MAGLHRKSRLPDRPVLLPIMVTVVGLAVLAVAQSTVNRVSIQNKLEQASVEALRSGGVTGAGVTFTGRDAVIVAGSPADAARATTIVEGVTGVRVASSRISGSGPVAGEPSATPSATPSASPAPESATPATSEPDESGATPRPLASVAAGRLPVGFTFEDGVLRVTGTVPSDDDRDAVIDAVSAVGGWAVVDQLRIDQRLAPADPGWIRSLTRLAATVPLDGSRIVARYAGDQVIVRGTPATPEIERSVLRAASATVSDKSQVLDGLDVPATR